MHLAMTRTAALPNTPTAPTSRRISPMGIAAGISLVLHLGLLAVHVAEPESASRIFEETPLEVILVNARSDEAPDQPQAIAQYNLAGGGDLDRPGVRATSPLPPEPYGQFGTELGPVPTDGQDDGSAGGSSTGNAPSFQQLDALQREQMDLLVQVKQQIADLAAIAPHLPASSAQAQALQKKRQLLLNIVGEIERRIQHENSRPRRRYFGPSTLAGPQALYYDSLKQKIEEKGTSNFPTHNGVKLYGELTLRMVINHDGRVLETQIMKSSGNRMLDRRAEAIAVTAGPFGPFNQTLRQYTDELAVVSRFVFARNNTLETQARSYRDLASPAATPSTQ